MALSPRTRRLTACARQASRFPSPQSSPSAHPPLLRVLSVAFEPASPLPALACRVIHPTSPPDCIRHSPRPSLSATTLRLPHMQVAATASVVIAGSTCRGGACVLLRPSQRQHSRPLRAISRFWQSPAISVWLSGGFAASQLLLRHHQGEGRGDKRIARRVIAWTWASRNTP